MPNARGNPSTMRSPVPDVNRTSISWRHDIFGWSMRPWESVPAVRGAARRTPRVAWTIPIRTHCGQWLPRGYQTALSSVRGPEAGADAGAKAEAAVASLKTLKSLPCSDRLGRPQLGPTVPKLEPVRGRGRVYSRGAASCKTLKSLSARIAWARPQLGPSGQKLEPTRGPRLRQPRPPVRP